MIRSFFISAMEYHIWLTKPRKKFRIGETPTPGVSFFAIFLLLIFFAIFMSFLTLFGTLKKRMDIATTRPKRPKGRLGENVVEIIITFEPIMQF